MNNKEIYTSPKCEVIEIELEGCVLTGSIKPDNPNGFDSWGDDFGGEW